MGFSKVFKDLVERKERAESGKYNCIPFPFPRFRSLVPGIERGRYVCITASAKIGKSKFCDFMFVYEPLFFAIDNPQFRFKVIYFTLEVNAETKYLEFLSHLLYRLDNIVVSPVDLRSVNNEKPISQNVLDLLNTEEYQKYIKFYEEHIEYIDTIANPTGINKYCRDYAEKNGKFNHIPYKTTNEVTGEEETRMKLDPDNPYTPNDEEEYRIVIIDNAANLTTEKGLTMRETIDKMSKYCITLRNQLNYIMVLVQHQSLAAESLDAMKMDAMKPSAANLGDAKTVVRDINMLIGLYSPFKHNKKEFSGYDITKLKNYSRFMEIIDDRDYGANNNICPLFFNGASSFWAELPRPEDTQALNAVYSYIDSLEQKRREKTFFLKIFSKFRFKRNK
jgi:hypothetical protein